MRKQEKHNRFTTMTASGQLLNDKLSSLRCYWHVLLSISIAPTDMENDNKNKRPERVCTLEQ